ncbi:MAG: TIM44-like domain-containing protein [Bacilli bacterium]|nr:TIM44-like domain-containing protein [Bacilli bacterium]
MKEEILKYDPEFTESNFKTFIDNVFIQIHLSIMTKEIENIRHFVTEEIYEKIENKVKLLNEKNVIQMYDEINVKETHIESVEIVEGKIIIQVKLISRYMDYLINEDGDYVSGNNKHRIQKENNLIFTKIIDAEKLKSVRKCPGCGVTLDINRSGKCEYCGSTFDLDKKGWILTTLEV